MGNPRQNLGEWPARHRSIGALILREDGWARLQPSYERGRVITRQFVFEGNALQRNAVAFLASDLAAFITGGYVMPRI